MKPRETPKQLDNPDFSKLQKLCEDFMKDVAIGSYVDDAYPHYIFETAIAAIYGDGIWNFVNKEDDDEATHD